MKQKVMLVDDEVGVLNSLERLLRRDKYDILKADNGKDAVEQMKVNSDIAVIVCDMRMPEMDGAEVLSHAHDIVPNAARIALTGYADTNTILRCINDGRVSRFLLKPWEDDVIRDVVRESADLSLMKSENRRLEEKIYEQNMELQEFNVKLSEEVRERTVELEEAEKKIHTSMNSVLELLSNIMDMHGSGLRGHGKRVADMSRRLARMTSCDERKIETIRIAALLHDIGKLSIPPSILEKSSRNMTPEERDRYRNHPSTGYEILRDLAGFEEIASIIRHHHESMSGSGYPDGLKGSEIPLGSRIICISDTYDRYRFPPGEAVIGSAANARNVLEMARGSKFDPKLVDLFLSADIPSYTEEGEHEIEVSISNVAPGMVLSKDIVNCLGKPLVREGTILDDAIIDHLVHNAGFDSIVSRIFVLRDSMPNEDGDVPAGDEVAVKHENAAMVKPLVVVVDDEQHVLNAMRRELRSGGYDVEVFTNPVDAMQQLRLEDNVLALVTDYNMPGVRGDRFLAQVQKEFPSMPCIVVTGGATKDTVVALRKVAKVTRIIPKPWDKKVLLSTLDEIKANVEI